MLTIGMSQTERLLLVVHAEQGRTIGIISARKATRHERETYEARLRAKCAPNVGAKIWARAYAVNAAYLARYAKGTNLVLLNDKVAKAFPTAEAVNAALQNLIDFTEQPARITGGAAAPTKRRRAA